ncbi:glucosaminidase domain-containing protein [Chitinophaga oryzae]|uniref:Glucosaminidase domain-containing protein n=1 Tax=Chitinophaga oryzae TaxID=2725414 RepID=A0ABX6LHW3_9BACT|nr:glucosaminidase domain-containing protein [Chitinophaga oryzae]QJB39718.1 glucosaminidase domain-containing protein [Chitinophaga oryzae]
MRNEEIKKSFFNLYYHSAVKSERETGVPALVTLSQAALESGWGNHAPGNMFFGVKAGPSWTGKRQLLKTKEVHVTRGVKYPEVIGVTCRQDGKFEYVVKDWFRAYDNAEESFRDHGFTLKNARWKKGGELIYAEAFEHIDDPVAFVEAMAKHYATDPTYAKKLKGLITDFSQFVPK